jgi:flagellar biosynthetic protein FliP
VKRSTALALITAAVLVALAARLQAAPQDVTMKLDGVGSVSAPLQIVIVLTLLSFLPAVLVIMTSFTRIVIVLHFLRQAIGSQDMPPNQVLVGLTLFLTAFIMAPVAERINDRAVQPVLAGTMSMGDGMAAAAPPMREFMLKQTRETDLALFVDISKTERPSSAADLPMLVVIPAYAISELKTGFQMGFFVFVPFLLIDLVVSTTLLSMGMLQLPPAMISLPFKLLLFVMVDGWNLIVNSIVRSFA